MKDKEVFSTGQVAKICNVTQATVWNWVRKHKIIAYQTPGGRYLVKRPILLQFLKKHNIPIPSDLEFDGKKKVLIVDDDSSIVSVISKKFRMQNGRYEIDSALDGYEAGKKVQMFHPDLIILDIRMPKLDGFKVCQDIKRDPSTEGVKVMAITGFPDSDSIERIFECGADVCFKKPLQLDDLERMAEILLFLNSSIGDSEFEKMDGLYHPMLMRKQASPVR